MRSGHPCFFRNTRAVAVPLEAVVAFSVVLITIAFLLISITHFFTPYVNNTESDLNYKLMDVCESLITKTGQTTYGSTDWERNPGNMSLLGLAASPDAYTRTFTTLEYARSVPQYRLPVPNSGFLYPFRDIIVPGYSSPINRPTIFSPMYTYPGTYYDTMLRTQHPAYAVLDQNKITALSNNNVSYKNATLGLGLPFGYDFNITITETSIGTITTTNVVLQYGPSYENADTVIPYFRDVVIFPSTPAKLVMYIFAGGKGGVPNDPPFVFGIPDQTIRQWSTFTDINLDEYVTDKEDPDSAISWTNSAASHLSVNIDAVSHFATITLEVGWHGTETVTFTATDSGGLQDSDTATFTVTAWWHRDWLYRKQITIDHTKVAVGGSLTNFPVLINTSDKNLKDHALTNGYDIAFVSSDNKTKLNHEIESYANGKLVAWVNVPNLNSISDTTILMYYGNGRASNQQNPTGVWDGNYVGVWHLNESVGNRRDSTSYNHKPGSPQQDVSYLAGGKINGANNFGFIQPGGGRIEVNHALDLNIRPPSNSITVEAWVNLQRIVVAPNNQFFVAKDDPTKVTASRGYSLRQSPNAFTFYVGGLLNPNPPEVSTTSTPRQNVWYHVVGEYGPNLVGPGNQLTIYINGIINNSINAGPINFINTMKLAIGQDSNNLNPTKGYIDEVRISNIDRSNAWILTEYNNQNAPSSFLWFGSEYKY
jgi:hypothetical protein